MEPVSGQGFNSPLFHQVKGKTIKYIFFISILLFMISCNNSKTMKNTTDKQISKQTPYNDDNPTQDQNNSAISTLSYQKMLKTGMDVDWAKTSEGRDWARKSHEEGINVPQIFKNRGLSHVRIRVKDDVLSDPTLLQEIKDLIDDCFKADLIPIIAYQAKEFKENPTDDSTLNHVVAWWQKITETFKDRPYKLAYDIVIETTEEVKKHNDRLNLLYKTAVDKIHQIDPKRICIVAANRISSPFELKNLEIPTPSDYVMAEWHFYAAGPNKTQKNPKKYDKVWTTGTPEEKKLLTDRFDTALNWQKNNVPTWVGAWMSNNFNHGNEYSIKEQVEFATFVSKELQKRAIPYAVNSDTKFYNREKNEWLEEMKPVLDAMIKRY